MAKHVKREAAFQKTVIELAQIHGWKVAHFRPAMNANGEWRTAVAGDGTGFPDLVCVHRQKGCFVAELKAGTNVVSDEQNQWLSDFEAAGVPAFVWRGTDWLEIEETLTNGPTP